MRRMLVPEVKLKSKIADDKSTIIMNELEPYVENGIVIVQVILSDLPNLTSNSKTDALILSDEIEGIGYFIRNGAIITLKTSSEGIRAYGDFYSNNDDAIPYDFLYFDEHVLTDVSISTSSPAAFDLYVINN